MSEKKPVIVFGFIALMNLLIVGFCLFFMTSSGVQAQDDKDETLPDDTVVFDVYPHPFSRGALAYSLADRWNRTDLTYYFHNCPSTIDCNDGQQAVRAGFQAWADLSPLTFTEVNSPRQADIELMWTTDTPELGSIGGVLAFAYFPSDGGDVFFDDNEPWSAFDGSEFDLYLVAAHEIGHALGLNHSSDPDALMYPVLTRRTFGLAPDDSAAIQALYGENEDNEPESQPIPSQPSEDVEEAAGEITDDVPSEYWEFDAFAGETVTVTMTTTSGDLVPYIGILTGDEEEVLTENGSSNGVSAQVSYTFDQDGTYVIVATREGVEEGFTAGTYELRLDFSEGTTDAPNVPDDADVVLATVRSYSSVDLCELYISPSTEDEWGDNQIDGILTYGNYIDFEVTPGLYDVLAVGCDGSEVEQYEIDIQQDLEIEIYEDGINIYVYGE